MNDGVLNLVGVMFGLGLAGALIVAAVILSKALAQRIEGRSPEQEAGLDSIQARLSALENLQDRMAELEERVDFSERLLVNPEQRS